ncbi:MAG: FAD:protein FMN transferase [Micrococcales bacterium]|nr:FAD:protein FMN transferase [Micrococcales bacterium]
MPISLAMRGRHADDERAWQRAMDSLRRADEVFSTYREESFISRLDRGEVTLAQCPPEVAEVLALGHAASIASGGAFSIWRPGLDPSGVVKGWAVEQAAEYLRDLPDTDFCLSAGGDMVCHAHDVPWKVGIENPRDPGRLVATVSVRQGAVATSGTAHRGEHVVDARDGSLPQGVASVTVVGPSLTWADIDATAAYALGQRAAAWLTTRPRRTGLVVWADGTPQVVSGPGAHAA